MNLPQHIEYYNKAVQYKQNGDYHLAVINIKLSIELVSNAPDYWRFLGELSSILKWHGEAINSYEESIRHYKRPEDIYYSYCLIAEENIKIKEYKNAKRALEIANKINPHGIKLLLNFGNLYKKSNEISKAFYYLDKAAQVAPQSSALKIKAKILFKQGETKLAIENLKNLLSNKGDNSKDPELELLIAKYLFVYGDYDGSLAYFMRANDSYTEAKEALIKLRHVTESKYNNIRKTITFYISKIEYQKSVAEYQKGELTKALFHAEKANEIMKTKDNFIQIANIYKKQNNFKEEADNLIKAIEFGKPIHDLLNSVCNALYNINDNLEIFEFIKKSIHTNTLDAFSWFNFGRTLIRHKAYKEALEAFNISTHFNKELIESFYGKHIVYSLLDNIHFAKINGLHATYLTFKNKKKEESLINFYSFINKFSISYPKLAVDFVSDLKTKHLPSIHVAEEALSKIKDYKLLIDFCDDNGEYEKKYGKKYLLFKAILEFHLGNPISSFNLFSEIRYFKEYEPIINFYLLKISDELLLSTIDYENVLNRTQHNQKEQQFFIGKYFFDTGQFKKAESIFQEKIFYNLVLQNKTYPDEDFFLPIGVYNSLIQVKLTDQPELRSSSFSTFSNRTFNVSEYLSSKSSITINHSKYNDYLSIDIDDALIQIINYCIYCELLESISQDEDFPSGIVHEKKAIYHSKISAEIHNAIIQSYIEKRLEQLKNKLFDLYENQLRSNVQNLNNSFENIKRYEELLNNHNLVLKEYFDKLFDLNDKSKLESYFGLVIYDGKLIRAECEIILQYLIIKEKIDLRDSYILFMYIFYTFSYKDHDKITDEAITEGLKDFVKMTWQLFNIISGPVASFLSGGIVEIIKRYMPKVNQGLKYKNFKKEYLKIINSEIETMGWEQFAKKNKIHTIMEINEFLK